MISRFVVRSTLLMIGISFFAPALPSWATDTPTFENALVVDEVAVTTSVTTHSNQNAPWVYSVQLDTHMLRPGVRLSAPMQISAGVDAPYDSNWRWHGVAGFSLGAKDLETPLYLSLESGGQEEKISQVSAAHAGLGVSHALPVFNALGIADIRFFYVSAANTQVALNIVQLAAGMAFPFTLGNFVITPSIQGHSDFLINGMLAGKPVGFNGSQSGLGYNWGVRIWMD